jgi:membrane protease subunit HflC
VRFLGGTLVSAIFGLIAAYLLMCFQVAQGTQAIVLQFGKPIKSIQEPGLYFKLPFLQNVIYFEKRLLEYDAAPRELITRDKQQLVVDNFSRWRIVDPLKFYQSVTTINGAQSRLDDIIYSNLRENIGHSSLNDVVSGDRAALMERVTSDSNLKAEAYGVEVVDVRIKRADLPAKNEQNVFNRMRTERERQAKKFRAEGEEEARRIRSQAEKESQILLAEAAREAQVLRGQAEAAATTIFAAAYNRDPEFYRFMRTLEAYRKTIANRTTLVLDPDAEFFQLLQSSK